jgi:tRNA-2-methylthio-N6-dimethylallyladenosine synthase
MAWKSPCECGRGRNLRINETNMTKRYHIWTIGCQMNVADSGRVAAELDALGYAPTDDPKQADVIVLNTCVVRQSAEDRAVGRLWSLRPLKQHNPERVIALMGCLVGVKPNPALVERFPFVDVFMPPSDPSPLVAHLAGHQAGQALENEARELDDAQTGARYALQDESTPEAAAIGLVEAWPDEIVSDRAEGDERGGAGEEWAAEAPTGRSPSSRILPLQSIRHLSLNGEAPVAANVPIVYGCSHACAFCIIPYMRGVERSRPLAEVVAEVQGLVDQGVREITLLGQIVDRYGKDFSDGRPDLADLLHAIHEIDGLWRIRFLTSHPNYMTDRILQAVAELPKVCEQIEVPVQAGDDLVLERMKRGYTREQYRELVGHIRDMVPGAAIHTDIIVGFPGESDEQFRRTYDLLAELRLDKAHLAMYSPRPGTVSARRMPDDVPAAEKKRRWDTLDALQAEVVGEINRRSLGETVEVLVEDRHRGNPAMGMDQKERWRGRTRTNKLVFFADASRDWRGQLAQVRIIWTGPWSMIGEVVA